MPRASIRPAAFFTDASNFSVSEIALPGTGTGAVSVAFSGPASLDLQIDRIETIVPEPGSCS